MFGIFNRKTKAEKLFEAITAGKTAKALRLIAKMNDFSQQNNNGFTALMLAIKEGNTEIAEKLIDKMDDVSQQDNDGFSALMWAIKKSNDEIAQAIIEKMDDISQKNKNATTALTLATEKGYQAIEKILKLKMGDYDTTLLHLLETGREDEAKKLMKEKFSKENVIKTAIKNGDARLAEKALSGELATDLSKAFKDMQKQTKKIYIYSADSAQNNQQKKISTKKPSLK